GRRGGALPQGRAGHDRTRGDRRPRPRDRSDPDARVVEGRAPGGAFRAARRRGGRGVRAAVTALAASPARAGVFLELTKPRITTLVLVTAAVGYAVGAGSGLDPTAFLALLAGTAMVAGGASALNQYAEREADA